MDDVTRRGFFYKIIWWKDLEVKKLVCWLTLNSRWMYEKLPGGYVRVELPIEPTAKGVIGEDSFQKACGILVGKGFR